MPPISTCRGYNLSYKLEFLSFNQLLNKLWFVGISSEIPVRSLLTWKLHSPFHSVTVTASVCFENCITEKQPFVSALE